MRKSLLLLLFVVTFSLIGGAILAETAVCQSSIFQMRKDSRIHVFRDQKARKTGDLLTVIIQVKTDANSQNRRQGDKTTSADATGDAGFSGSGGTGSLQADYSTDSNRSFSGNSSMKVANTFTDRFTVAVLDVQPNGNLIIGGKRRVNVGGEDKVIVLTGIVRAVDVEHDNAIHSQLVAGLNLKYETTGTSNAYTRQGWLSKKMNLVWPF